VLRLPLASSAHCLLLLLLLVVAMLRFQAPLCAPVVASDLQPEPVWLRCYC
jgi:hypothetical protein